MFLGEEFGAGGVAHLAVQGDDVTAGGAERGERLSVGVAGGDLVPGVVAGQFEVAGADGVQHPCRGRLLDLHVQVAHSAEFGDRLLGVRQRFAVQALAVLDGLDTLALERAGDDHGGLSRGGLGLGVRAVDGVGIVSVDLHGVPAEGLEPARVRVEVVAVPGRTALAQPVDVDDRDEVVEVLVSGVLGALPDGSLGEFAVAAQHPHPVAGVVEPFAGQCDADRHGQPLAERAGGGLDPREPPGCRMPFEAAAEPAEGEQFGLADGPGRPVGGVQER